MLWEEVTFEVMMVCSPAASGTVAFPVAFAFSRVSLYWIPANPVGSSVALYWLPAIHCNICHQSQSGLQ